MVAPVNDFDVRLQAQVPRTLAPRGGVILSTTTNVVTVGAGGTPSPSVITLVATPLSVIAGSITFTTSPTVPLSIDPTGKIATLQYSDMGTGSVTVTVKVTANGVDYFDSRTISQVSIGSLGYQGALDATRNNTSQGLISARPAGSDGDFYFATDELILYQKTGGLWRTAGNNFTNTNQLTDGAGLGQKAVWSNVSSRPSNVAALTGTEDIKNDILLPAVYQAQVTTFSECKKWEFNSSLEGWGYVGIATPTLNPTSVTISSNGTDPIFRSPSNLNFSGQKYDKVRARVKRLNSTGIGWDGSLYFDKPSGSGEGYLGRGFINTDPTKLNQWVILEWDMSGVTGWTSNTIEHFRIDLGSTASDSFEIDWVAVGRYGVGSDEIAAAAAAAQTAADTANAAIANISSDNVLSKGEKSDVIRQFDAMNQEFQGLVDQAANLTVSSTNYYNSKVALNNYLNVTIPTWNNPLVDTAIVGSDFRSFFNAYYTARQALVNAMAAKAATLADWSGVGNRPADSALLNTYNATGNNLCYNADFSNGLDGWTVAAAGVGAPTYGYVNSAHSVMAGLDWTINRGVGVGCTTLHVLQDNATQGAYFEMQSDPIPVVAGKRYCVSAYTGAHRCKVDVFAYIYDSSGSGNPIGNWGNDADYNNENFSGGPYLSNYKRHQQAATMPAGAAYVRVVLRKFTTNPINNYANSWMFVGRVQLEEVGASATNAGPWNPPAPGIGSYMAIANAKAALDIIGSDSYLSKGEKLDVVQRWNTCDNEKASLVPQANNLGVSSADYVAAHTSLSNYLISIPKGWSDTTTDSPIVPLDWRNAWNGYYNEKQKLINAMTAKAATVATNVLIPDTRSVDSPPSSYAVGVVKEFKLQTAIGIPGAAANTYCTIETSKGWTDSSGGNAIQWAYIDSSTVYKRSAGNSATSWGAWVRDLDRSVYTGDLNATNGATLGPGGNVTGKVTNTSDISNFLGTYTSPGTARTMINDYGIQVYDGNNRLRIKIGQL